MLDFLVAIVSYFFLNHGQILDDLIPIGEQEAHISIGNDLIPENLMEEDALFGISFVLLILCVVASLREKYLLS